MKIIVGLGNPGQIYSKTRHNVGFLTINNLAKHLSINTKKIACNCRLGQGKIFDEEVVLAKPKTYMNLSGKAVKALIDRYKVLPEDIIVIYDDSAIELGKIRIRQKGSSGGHKGIESIIQTLGTDQFIRIRIGIGKPHENTTLTEYVLSEFLPDEEEIIKNTIKRATHAIIDIFKDRIEQVMQRYNT